MRDWAIAMAITVVVVVVTCVYDFNGRTADAVQRLAGQLSEFPFVERAACSQQLQKWAPDDSVAVLMSYSPAGHLLVAGIAISFLMVAISKAANLSHRILMAIGIAGCAAVVLGNDFRIREYGSARKGYAEWEQTVPATSDSVLMKDSFLFHLLFLQRATVLLNAGLIAMGLSSGCAIALVAVEKPTNTGTKPE